MLGQLWLLDIPVSVHPKTLQRVGTEFTCHLETSSEKYPNQKQDDRALYQAQRDAEGKLKCCECLFNGH